MELKVQSYGVDRSSYDDNISRCNAHKEIKYYKESRVCVTNAGGSKKAMMVTPDNTLVTEGTVMGS